PGGQTDGRFLDHLQSDAELDRELAQRLRFRYAAVRRSLPQFRARSAPLARELRVLEERERQFRLQLQHRLDRPVGYQVRLRSAHLRTTLKSRATTHRALETLLR